MLTPLIEKIHNIQALNKKGEELKLEQAKIKLIDLKLQEIDDQLQRVNINPILEKYTQLFNCYNDIVVKNEDYKHISESIDLISEISFDIDNFRRDFSDYITKNRTLENIFDGHGFIGNNFNFIIDEHLENIRYICNKMLNDTASEIGFNQGKQKQEIINTLFNNYFDISYDLMQGTDTLGHMSPG